MPEKIPGFTSKQGLTELGQTNLQKQKISSNLYYGIVKKNNSSF